MSAPTGPAVILTVVAGPLRGQVYEFDERTSCIAGRAGDCVPRLPDDDDHRTVSRHHCLFDVNPPDARVRDFGSLNGTYLNGTRIGQRVAGQTPEAAAGLALPEHDLRDGDQIRLGDTVLQVGIRVGRAAIRVLARCSVCGTEAGDEMGGQGDDHVCAQCRSAPGELVQGLLSRADAGESGLDRIAGYAIVRELGVGGMGRVDLAREVATGREFALKTMLSHMAADRAAQSRFLREVEVNLSLDHPGIARLHHYGATGGLFWFTTEFCAGGSLEDRLARDGTMPAADAVPLVLQALVALEYAHGRGVVHRDLTPHNVLLAGPEHDVVKLADFGLAKLFDQAGLSGLTRTGTAAGKPTYMPYQQVVNFRFARPAVDVWALAACLYRMLTGTSPREFAPDRDPWQVVLQTDAVPIRQRLPGLAGPLADVIDTALRDKPAIGYATAADLHRALVEAWR